MSRITNFNTVVYMGIIIKGIRNEVYLSTCINYTRNPIRKYTDLFKNDLHLQIKLGRIPALAVTINLEIHLSKSEWIWWIKPQVLIILKAKLKLLKEVNRKAHMIFAVWTLPGKFSIHTGERQHRAPGRHLKTMKHGYQTHCHFSDTFLNLQTESKIQLRYHTMK